MSTLSLLDELASSLAMSSVTNLSVFYLTRLPFSPTHAYAFIHIRDTSKQTEGGKGARLSFYFELLCLEFRGFHTFPFFFCTTPSQTLVLSRLSLYLSSGLILDTIVALSFYFRLMALCLFIASVC